MGQINLHEVEFTAILQPLAASALDKNPPHRLGGGKKWVALVTSRIYYEYWTLGGGGT